MWLDELKKMKNESGLTTKEISNKSGIPEPTLEKLFAGATKDPKLTTIQQLVHFFGHTLDDLTPEASSQTKNAPSLSDEALRVARDYNNLDKWGKRVVQSVISDEQARMAAEAAQAEAQPPVPVTKIIPLLGNSFAAGKGDPDFGNMWEDYEVSLDSPAEFAIRINGDSMEPYLEDNSIAYGKKRTPKDGEVAALLVDGEFLVKQVCEDHLGNLYLFALNRERKDADITIWNDSGRSVLCFGTIIMPREVPLPFR